MEASSDCPICGFDRPHLHNGLEVAKHRGAIDRKDPISFHAYGIAFREAMDGKLDTGGWPTTASIIRNRAQEIQFRMNMGGEAPSQPAEPQGAVVDDAMVELVASALYRRDWGGEFEQPKKRWRSKVRAALEAALPAAQSSAKDGARVEGELRHDYSDNNGNNCAICGATDWNSGTPCPGSKATTGAGLVDGVRGECVECGTDPETGDIRIIIKTTMEALRDGPPLVYRDVTVSLSGFVKDQKFDDAAVNRALMADLPHGGKVCDYMRIPNHDTLEDVMRTALEAAIGREVTKP